MIRTILLKIHFFLSQQLGFSPIAFLNFFRFLPKYLSDFYLFKRQYSGRMKLYPCLGDHVSSMGAHSNEYFWQDLLVAQQIFESNPQKHVDIGSRLDGFIAHVASFREVEIFDIRPLNVSIPNVIFKQSDIMDIDSFTPDMFSCCDSLSCLHALEHFGLGRYGDPIDPHGYEKGLRSLSNILSNEGTLYLSTPIGRERVEFNANWVFSPIKLIELAQSFSLVLVTLTIISQYGKYQILETIDSSNLELLSNEHYNLGLFEFIKKDE